MRCSRGVIPVFLVVLAVGASLIVSTPVGAQSIHEGTSHLSAQQPDRGGAQYQDQGRQSQFPSNLPDWAEPSRLDRGNSGSADGSFSGSQDLQAAPPPPPPPPPQVPVDGGLAILAAAGAGYAVRRLNQEGEEDDEGEDELP